MTRIGLCDFSRGDGQDREPDGNEDLFLIALHKRIVHITQDLGRSPAACRAGSDRVHRIHHEKCCRNALAGHIRHQNA